MKSKFDATFSIFVTGVFGIVVCLYCFIQYVPEIQQQSNIEIYDTEEVFEVALKDFKDTKETNVVANFEYDLILRSVVISDKIMLCFDCFDDNKPHVSVQIFINSGSFETSLYKINDDFKFKLYKEE